MTFCFCCDRASLVCLFAWRKPSTPCRMIPNGRELQLVSYLFQLFCPSFTLIRMVNSDLHGCGIASDCTKFWIALCTEGNSVWHHNFYKQTWIFGGLQPGLKVRKSAWIFFANKSGKALEALLIVEFLTSDCHRCSHPLFTFVRGTSRQRAEISDELAEVLLTLSVATLECLSNIVMLILYFAQGSPCLFEMFVLVLVLASSTHLWAR